MMKHGLFVHGAGEGAFDEDGLLVNSLASQLTDQLSITYRPMPDEGNPTYPVWKNAINTTIRETANDLIVVGHSFGGSVLVKYLSEQPVGQVKALFVISAPFWNEDEGWQLEDLRLPDDLADRLAYIERIYFYHAQDDAIVPIAHLSHYEKRLPQASFHRIEHGGHQLNNDLSEVAANIRHVLSEQV